LNSFANEIGSPVNDQDFSANSHVKSIGFLNGVNFRILKAENLISTEIGASADQLGQLNEKMEEFCEEYESHLEQHSVQKEFDELGHEFIDRLRKAYHWIYLTLKLPRSGSPHCGVGVE